jgi:SET domain-containing protein
MIIPSLFIASTPKKGRGVFTRDNIVEQTIVEIAPVIVMNNHDRILLDQTLLHDYIFEWGNYGKQCCIALGYISIYNHSYQSNCEYIMDYDKDLISIKTIRRIESGDELYINYNGDWDNGKRVWFQAH